MELSAKELDLIAEALVAYRQSCFEFSKSLHTPAFMLRAADERTREIDALVDKLGKLERQQ